MKKTISLIIISYLVASCGLKPEKTSEMESLLDAGFPEDSMAMIGKTEKNLDIFKSAATVHYGIDISHFQGDIMKTDIAKDSLSFAICKATQGVGFVDPKFRENWNEIKEKGLIRGTYHFYVCSDDPEEQANHFLATIGDVGPNAIAPILDIEQGSMSKDVSGKQMVADILVFLKAVEKKLNRKPILYTDYAFAQDYFKASNFSEELAEYDLWLAEYSGNAKPKVPTTWKDKGYKIWQKSSSYHIDSQRVDYDEFTGSLNEIVN
jgi:lysozyme